MMPWPEACDCCLSAARRTKRYGGSPESFLDEVGFMCVFLERERPARGAVALLRDLGEDRQGDLLRPSAAEVEPDRRVDARVLGRVQPAAAAQLEEPSGFGAAADHAYVKS